VRAWTNGVLHLDCRTTNRVESAHGKLKKYLSNSVGDLATSLGVIDKMLTIQLSEIQTTFGKSRTIIEHIYKGNFLYYELKGCVSRAVMSFIYEEAKLSKKTDIVKENCGCVIKTSYGLPYACILAMNIRKNLHIRLDDIDPHWQRLHVCEE